MEENSHLKFKQTKLSSYWSLRPAVGSGLSSDAVSKLKSKKRKNDENACHGSPIKKISLEIGCGSSTDKNVAKNDGEKQNVVNFDDFTFEDFENNPFLSPKKEKSPNKKVLAENCANSSGEENWKHDGNNELNFDSPKRCKVLKMAVATSDNFEQILLVRDEKAETKGLCRLRDAWTFSPISAGDTVVIQAENKIQDWVVDNKAGYVVVHPNTIVSATSLLKSSFCMRQGLLSHFYKGVESDKNERMIIGRLVHELFQKSLKLGSCTNEDFTSFANQYFRAWNYLHDFYFSNTSSEKVYKEVESYVPPIRTFLDVYLKKSSKPFGKNFSGTIEEIMDIEELITSSKLGLQGRVDVTVKMKSKNKTVETVAPLELKTGKASFSADHKNQLVLYILLMEEIGRRVESGLLLYLKEGLIEEVTPNRDEIRNLFLMRNKLVSYFKSLKENELPEPIRSHTCQKCPFLRICCSYLKTESLHETHPLRSVEFLDIKETHVEYFKLWNKLLWLEFGDVSDEETVSTEIGGLVLQPQVEKIGDEFRHHLLLPSGKQTKWLQPGVNVHVYENSGNRVSLAKVVNITGSSCYLLMEKKLTNTSATYLIAEFKKKFFNMYLSNIGLLMEERYRTLREIIVDKRPSTFEEKLDKKLFQEIVLDKLLPLNKDQQKAVLKSLLCKDYMLIKGPPGTGKTQTITAMARVFLALGKKVLIAGHTNSSVDNILLRLDDVEYLRLGTLKNTNQKIHGRSYANLSKKCTTLKEIQDLYDRMLIASTCLGLDEAFINKIKFDVCIVDESSQALECEILRPLLCAEKFILVGDDDQLPPIVLNSEAKKLEMGKSLFERLGNANIDMTLRLQYRMNSVINDLVNTIAYNGSVVCASEKVANATLRIESGESRDRFEGWVKEVLSPSLEMSIVFVDTSDYFSWKGVKSPEKPRASKLEVNLVKRLLRRMFEIGLDEEKVGVIAPFRDQIFLLKENLEGKPWSQVELGTVDQYQGRDKEVILFSCGKENQPDKKTSDLELLNDRRRLTVAITRAKHKLVLLGDAQTVKNYEPFRVLLENLKECQLVRLKDGERDFSWKNFDV